MSLPAAQKDISIKPAPGSVVDPVNRDAKDADVDRKIRLYGVISAFRQGRLPSNAQIDETLQYVLGHSPVRLEQLSPGGRKLVQDTRDIIETARQMVMEKNADELFQNFVWHTRAVEKDDLKNPDIGSPVEGDKAREDAQEAVKHLRTLLTLVLTNSEVRKLLTDFSLIGRDLLSKSLSKAAEGIAPAPDQLADVDQSAPADQFVTEGGRTAGQNETPVLEARLPGTDTTIRRHPADEEARVRDANGERGMGEVRDEMGQRVQQGTDVAGQRAEEGRARAGEEIQRTDFDNEEEVEAKKRGFMGRMRDMRDNINDRIPQQHKDRASDHVERTKRFLSEEYFPEERRDQFIYRGKKVIIECQKHDDYQESIRWLLGYIEEYAAHGRTVAGAGKEHSQGVVSDPKLKLPVSELRTLLERFANGQSMGIVFDAINQLIDDARSDEELRTWFKEVDAWIRKVLLEPGYVIEPDCNNQGNKLRESGRRFYDDRYRGHFDNLFDSLGTWFKAMGDDPINARFGEDWARLTKDLLFDDEGNLKFKPDLWNDIRKVILPELIEKVGYIPIPRIEYTDDALDLVVENLTLSGRNLFPNIVALEAHNFVKFSPYDAIKDDFHTHMTLTLEQIQADMRDVAFYYRKKSGIPKMSDSGIADVILGGEGLTATVHLASTKDKSSVFKVQNVNVKVDALKFSIRDSKHDFLYKTLRPLATGLIKKQLQKAISDAITTGLEYVDGQLVGVRDRMSAAKVNEGESRTKVLQEMFHRKKEEASIKSQDRASQFRVVSDKRNSLLSSTGHPAGWVNRTQEKQEKATTGEEWRSDAFSIVPGQHHDGKTPHTHTATAGATGAAGHSANTYNIPAAEPTSTVPKGPATVTTGAPRI